MSAHPVDSWSVHPGTLAAVETDDDHDDDGSCAMTTAEGVAISTREGTNAAVSAGRQPMSIVVTSASRRQVPDKKIRS